MGFYRYIGVSMGSCGSMGIYGSLWLFMGTYECLWLS